MRAGFLTKAGVLLIFLYLALLSTSISSAVAFTAAAASFSRSVLAMGALSPFCY